MSPAHRGRFVDRPVASTDGVQNGENKQNEACAYASKLHIREIVGWTDVKKRGLIRKMQGSAGGAASICSRPPGRFENKNMNTTLRVFQEGPPPPRGYVWAAGVGAVSEEGRDVRKSRGASASRPSREAARRPPAANEQEPMFKGACDPRRL